LVYRVSARELEKERDKQRDLAKERMRQIHAENESHDLDDHEEPWRRRPYRGRLAPKASVFIASLRWWHIFAGTIYAVKAYHCKSHEVLLSAWNPGFSPILIHFACT
jgi:hypothetical protein